MYNDITKREDILNNTSVCLASSVYYDHDNKIYATNKVL